MKKVSVEKLIQQRKLELEETLHILQVGNLGVDKWHLLGLGDN